MAKMQDLIVIGGGSGGFAAPMRAAQLGGRVTIVEEANYGGNCMNRACIPSKFLMTTARLMSSIRKAGHFGIQVGEPRLDMDALHHRQDLMVKGLRIGTERLLAEWGITRGFASPGRKNSSIRNGWSSTQCGWATGP
jgi:dihydrolipoamide dehydrogenase